CAGIFGAEMVWCAMNDAGIYRGVSKPYYHKSYYRDDVCGGGYEKHCHAAGGYCGAQKYHLSVAELVGDKSRRKPPDGHADKDKGRICCGGFAVNSLYLREIRRRPAHGSGFCRAVCKKSYQ